MKYSTWNLSFLGPAHYEDVRLCSEQRPESAKVTGSEKKQ